MTSLRSDSPIYLDTQLAMQQIGDVPTMVEMLVILKDTLTNDIEQIALSLQQGDVANANTLLHPLKGFLPIFCTPALCDHVTDVELMSKASPATAVAEAYSELRPKLDRLLGEVTHHLSSQGKP